MDCQLFERQMQRGIDNQLTAHEHEDMLKHALACPDCAALLQDMTALDGLLMAQLGSIEPPEGFAASVMSALPAPYRKPALRVLLPRKPWQRWGSVAAAAVLLVAAGVYGLFPSSEEGVGPEPIHPGIAEVLKNKEDNTPKPPNQDPNAGTQVADVKTNDTLTPDTLDPQENPAEDNTEIQPPVDTPTNTEDPTNVPVVAQPFSTSVDLPNPAAHNPQPEGVLSQVLLAAYEDCDAILPALNAEGLVEFYIKYKGITHLWTQTLTAEEAPVYVGQVKALPSLADITGSISASTEEGQTFVTAVSPDKRWLAVSRGGEQPGLWLHNYTEGADIATVLAEPGREITGAVGGGKMLSWSPDGNKLLYTDAAGKLHIYYQAEELLLTLYEGNTSCASWAGNSNAVLFAGKESKDQRSAIYTILVP